MADNDENVVWFPATTTFTPEQAIASAAQFDDLKEILIIGIDKEDNLLIRSSRMTRRDALWLLEIAKKNTMGDE